MVPLFGGGSHVSFADAGPFLLGVHRKFPSPIRCSPGNQKAKRSRKGDRSENRATHSQSKCRSDRRRGTTLRTPCGNDWRGWHIQYRRPDTGKVHGEVGTRRICGNRKESTPNDIHVAAGTEPDGASVFDAGRPASFRARLWTWTATRWPA